MATSSPPVNFLLPLYPVFQLLDVAGPLDILNLLSVSSGSATDLTLTFIASTLDPVPIKPIPPIDPSTQKPKWTFDKIPQVDGKANVTFNQTLTPDVTFDEYLAAVESGRWTDKIRPVDVLLIPGGLGTRIERTFADTGKTESNVADLVQFITQVAPHVRHSIMTVCTGSFVLAQAGLLDGRRATSNMTRFDDVAAANLRVQWLKNRRWVRSLPDEGGEDQKKFHGEIWTSAGISAGIDVMLAFVAQYFGGLDVAKTAAKRLEYEWRQIGEGEVDPMYTEG